MPASLCCTIDGFYLGKKLYDEKRTAKTFNRCANRLDGFSYGSPIRFGRVQPWRERQQLDVVYQQLDTDFTDNNSRHARIRIRQRDPEQPGAMPERKYRPAAF